MKFNGLQFPAHLAKPALAYAADVAQAEADLMLNAFKAKPLPTLADHRAVLKARKLAATLRREAR